MRCRLQPFLVSIPSRGFWFFEDALAEFIVKKDDDETFQSPRGDFGFLKFDIAAVIDHIAERVSIPSRGFWFFEGGSVVCVAVCNPS